MLKFVVIFDNKLIDIFDKVEDLQEYYHKHHEQETYYFIYDTKQKQSMPYHIDEEKQEFFYSKRSQYNKK